MSRLAILFAAAALSAGLAQALADPPARPPRGAAGDPNQLVCRSESMSSSRIKGPRVCLTRAQWREIEARSRALAREMQRPRPPACGSDPMSGMMC